MKQKKDTEIYLDGADLDQIEKFSDDNVIKGFTTNPSLIAQQNISHYEDFAKAALKIINNKPISFEVIADAPDEMINQGIIINKWSKLVYVKIPITTTTGVSCIPVIRELNNRGINVNITAVFSTKQIDLLHENLSTTANNIISVFAGRIADTGRDPCRYIKYCVDKFTNHENYKTLWASTREVYNIYQAQDCQCDIITVPYSMIGKLANKDRNLEEFSISTIRQFYTDALDANLTL